MTTLKFIYYIPDEQGTLARMETTGEEAGVPLNILAVEGSDFDLAEGVVCELDLYGLADDLKVYEDEDAYGEVEKFFAPLHMIPAGAFPKPEDEGEEYVGAPIISFSGRVEALERDEEAPADQPNYSLTVTTYGLEFTLFTHFDGEIKEGNIVAGEAWLYAEI